MITVNDVQKVAKSYYDEKTYEHAKRVCNYVIENQLIPTSIKYNCFVLAWMHDLLEDTDFRPEPEFDEYLLECLIHLTKSREEDYLTYIKRIKSTAHIYPEVYWVKLADMKDHLAQKETLTDKLKKKYLEALPYLL